MSIESRVAHAVMVSHRACDEVQARAVRRSADEAGQAFASMTPEGLKDHVC